MTDKQKKIYEILMTTIKCNERSKKATVIRKNGSIIETTQTYYSGLDADMSDFSVGFYEILYQDILDTKPILNDKKHFFNNDFAGDTMNSFNTIANRVPEAGKAANTRTSAKLWPEYLQDYNKQYHCLANFWLIPMGIGRTSGELSKTGNGRQDYMDRFLIYFKNNVSKYKYKYSGYFEKINSISDLAERNILMGNYVDTNMVIDEFSNREDANAEIIIEKITEKIKNRAIAISESKYADALWEYFKTCGLLG